MAASRSRLTGPPLPHVHAHRLLRRRRVYRVHQIFTHGSEVRIDDYVDDAAAADLLEFVKRQFGNFVVQFGHVCLLFDGQDHSRQS